MPKSKDLVTIDLSALAMIEQEGDKFLIEPKAEDALLTLLDLERRVEQAKELVKTKLGDAMRALNCLKIEGNGVKVVRRYYGERYEVSDPEIALKLGVAKKVESIKPDTKQVDSYISNVGELPEGIKLRERKDSVTITEVEEK